MPVELERLAWEDKIKLTLRALYEQYGFRQYRMGKFEPYDMYYEHKDFLKSETVITFTDTAGRLMALKPDVTMSIVKGTQPDDDSRKLYYIENVFRMAPGSREYGEISQIGIESIGGEDIYAETETVLLAVKTLEAISPRYILDVSHMGFVAAVLSACGFDEAARAAALEALTHKNLQELMALAEAAGVSVENCALLRRTASVSDTVPQAVAVFRAMPLDAEMTAALDEIEQVYTVLDAAGCAAQLRLDFTVVNNMDYYNGIVFRGYIENLPRAVLAGGRYDNLMRRFRKPQSALGFALYLGELTRAFTSPEQYDTDCLVLYGEASPETVMRAVAFLLEDGKGVRAEKTLPKNIRARRIYRLEPDGRLEVSSGD